MWLFIHVGIKTIWVKGVPSVLSCVSNVKMAESIRDNTISIDTITEYGLGFCYQDFLFGWSAVDTPQVAIHNTRFSTTGVGRKHNDASLSHSIVAYAVIRKGCGIPVHDGNPPSTCLSACWSAPYLLRCSTPCRYHLYQMLICCKRQILLKSQRDTWRKFFVPLTHLRCDWSVLPGIVTKWRRDMEMLCAVLIFVRIISHRWNFAIKG